MRRAVAALVAVLFLALPAQAQAFHEDECPVKTFFTVEVPAFFKGPVADYFKEWGAEFKRAGENTREDFLARGAETEAAFEDAFAPVGAAFEAFGEQAREDLDPLVWDGLLDSYPTEGNPLVW